MERGDAHAVLAKDAHKVVGDAVLVHAVGDEVAHSVAEQVGRDHVIVQMAKDTGDVQALAAGGLDELDAVDVIDLERARERVGRID